MNAKRKAKAASGEQPFALRLLADMLRIRRMEEKCAELYGAGKIRGFLHLYIGEEACATGAMHALAPEDNVVATYREHGHALLQSGPGSVIRLDFIDNGQGVPESLRSLLFLPLVTGRRNGTGLGLALSQQIASAHGGLVTFEALQQGSRFTLLLPFNQAEESPSGQRSR